MNRDICHFRGRVNPGGKVAGIGSMTMRDGRATSGGTALAISVVGDDQTCACFGTDRSLSAALLDDLERHTDLATCGIHETGAFMRAENVSQMIFIAIWTCTRNHNR